MTSAQAAFEVIREKARPPGLTGPDEDLLALPDGRIVPLDWDEAQQVPEVDRGSDATWD